MLALSVGSWGVVKGYDFAVVKFNLNSFLPDFFPRSLSDTEAAASPYLNGVKPVVSSAGFTHPGVFIDLPTLESVRQKIKNNEEPQASIFRYITNNDTQVALSDLKPDWSLYSDRNDIVRKLDAGTLKNVTKDCPVGTTTVNPPGCVKRCVSSSPQGCMLNCGWQRSNNAAADREKTDACKINLSSQINSAYTNALLYYYTGKQAYGEKAVETLNAYGKTFKGFVSTADNKYVGILFSGWTTQTLIRAAEIIRYTYKPATGKPAFDVATFTTMLKTAFEPNMHSSALDKKPALYNWRTSAIEGLLNIAVFTDDRTLYNQVVRLWRGQVTSLIYLKSDGTRPAAMPASTLATDLIPRSAVERDCSWIVNRSSKCQTSTKTSPGLVYQEGQSAEICRDLWHATALLGGLINVAETARIQKTDLYGEQRVRLQRAISYTLQLQQSVSKSISLSKTGTPTYPTNFCAGSATYNTLWIEDYKRITPLSDVVAYNHYTTRNNLKFPTVAIPGYTDTYPNGDPVRTYIENNQANKKSDTRGFITSWQTLTHYGVGKGVTQ